jgi:hypothetical protein
MRRRQNGNPPLPLKTARLFWPCFSLSACVRILYVRVRVHTCFHSLRLVACCLPTNRSPKACRAPVPTAATLILVCDARAPGARRQRAARHLLRGLQQQKRGLRGTRGSPCPSTPPPAPACASPAPSLCCPTPLPSLLPASLPLLLPAALAAVSAISGAREHAGRPRARPRPPPRCNVNEPLPPAYPLVPQPPPSPPRESAGSAANACAHGSARVPGGGDPSPRPSSFPGHLGA